VIRFSARGAYLDLVLQGRTLIRDRVKELCTQMDTIVEKLDVDHCVCYAALRMRAVEEKKPPLMRTQKAL